MSMEPLDSNQTSKLDLESAESGNGPPILERLRHIEAVTARGRQRRQTLSSVDQSPLVERRVAESRRSYPADLVARALVMEEPKPVPISKIGPENFFDCNICLKRATRDPVLTCCGHLFCWPCFYNMPCYYSNARQCPVCKGEVTEESLVPIYGKSGSSSNDNKLQLELEEAGLRIPSRPRAQRVDGIRQQLVREGFPSSLVSLLQSLFED